MNTILMTLGAISAVAVAASVLAFMGLPYRPLGVEFLQNNPYAPLSISAGATGRPAPSQMQNLTLNDTVLNGDFRIPPGSGVSPARGAGINEVTAWDLDFTRDSQFDRFPTTTPLGSARLDLTLTPKSLVFRNDIVRISGLSMINPAIYSELPQDTPSSVQLELLEFYSSEDILRALTANHGIITMSAGSNAIVSSAELVLASAGQGR